MDKVAIHLYCCPEVGRDDIKEILCGIEEEGIPSTVTAVTHASGLKAGNEAAQSSRLSVGIGVSKHTITLHHQKTGTQPLLTENWNSPDGRRRLGANSARLIKGTPFLFPGDHE